MIHSDFVKTSNDWRGQLKRNERRTLYVISLFLLIYISVGFIIDLVLLQSAYPGFPLSQYAYVLLIFKKIPYATLIMAAIGGISLFVTYAFYDKIMLLGTEYHEVTPENAGSLQEKQLYHVVEEMKVASGLRFMPKIFIIDADYMNAFASGYSERSAMVAITRGLMEKLDRAELQAVMAHELSHIRHHDIKLTLMAAVLSNILLIALDFLFYSVLYRRDENGKNSNPLFMAIIVLRYVLPILTILLTLFLSRTREFMADSGAVGLMRDNEPMARALLKIHGDYQTNKEQYTQAFSNTANEQLRRASYLYDPMEFDAATDVSSVFSTHPTLKQRLEAIGFKPKI